MEETKKIKEGKLKAFIYEIIETLALALILKVLIEMSGPWPKLRMLLSNGLSAIIILMVAIGFIGAIVTSMHLQNIPPE